MDQEHMAAMAMASDPYRVIRTHSAQLPSDHWSQLAYLPYFRYGTRQEIEAHLTGSLDQYVLRNCNDPAEFINGQPNPNLFVISYRTHDGAQMVYRHIKVLRVIGAGLTFTSASVRRMYFPTLRELLANSVTTAHLQPYLVGEQEQEHADGGANANGGADANGGAEHDGVAG